MIAERPTKASNVSASEENLFEGLSFPEVPTAPVAPPVYAPPVVASKSPEVLQRPESKSMSADTTPKAAVSVTEVKKPANLSALYATEVVTSDSRALYPDLPSFAEHLEEQDTAYIHNNYSAEQSEETASLLPRQSSAAVPIAASRPAYNPHIGTRDEAPELVTDLVMENSRLAEEVANLRRILEDQSHNGTHARSAPSGTTSAMHTQVSHAVTQQQQQMQGQAQQAQNQQNTITGVQITDTTRPPEKGVKYVCCGGCRQWLMAPRDAVYVACGRCEAINNCNLAPRDSTDSHNLTTETRALTQRNNGNDNPFWFLDCFSRGLF